ncbi:HAD-IA family hydrolase [Joostella sp. CR20]|uniref:HAD-IA family hydrolase n=1 Tax=Joostella sp. CR20 TaxID=2804312 RepID=UPI00313C1DC3
MPSTTPIKNIVFDFGDIFIDLDKEAPLKLMLQTYPNFTLTKEISKLNDAYEKGEISTPDFVASYKDFLSEENSETLIHIWNSIILTMPTHRLTFIENLHKQNKYRLFLLSNTNELHIEQVINNIGFETYTQFKNCFEKFYLSHEIHFRKPTANIFDFVLRDNAILAEETLFIDDTKEHIDTAKSLGFYTWNLIPGKEDVTSLFEKDFTF